MKKERRLSGIGAGIMLSACLSFLIGVYAPLELYLTNVSEFWMKFTELIPPAAILFAGFFIVLSVLFIIARLINKSFYDFCLAGGFAGFLGFYICGNFLVKNLPPMNGTVTEWGKYLAEIIKSGLAFIIPFAVLLFVFIKFKSKIIRKVTFIGSLCFMLLLTATLSTLIITTDLEKPATLASTQVNLFKMSEDKNLVVLVLDTLDGDVFREAIENNSEAKEMFDGFTCFDNTTAAYPHTECAVPVLFSGKWYQNDGDFKQYSTSAISDSPFIQKLENNGYSIGIYESGELNLREDVFEDRFENCFPSAVKYNDGFIYCLMLKMGGVKFAPWLLKSQCEHIDIYLNRVRKVKTDSDFSCFNWSDAEFYNKIKDKNPVTVYDEKCARIIHLEGGHVPFYYDNNFNIISGGTYQRKVEACVNLLKQYVKNLKESGVYDNTAIVVVGDHGFGGMDVYDISSIKKRMHTGFMVKGIDEHHELKYSSAPIQFDEIAEGITKLIDGATSNEIFNASENEQKIRKMILYLYNDKNHMKEYFTDGKANDENAMKPSGKEYNAD